MISLADALESCCARQCSVCRRMGSKLRCMRSTPIATLSCREEFFECFASTGVNALGTMRQFYDAHEIG